MDLESLAVSEPCLGVLFESYAPSVKRMLRARGGNLFAGWGSRVADDDFDDLLQDAFLCLLACSPRVPTSRVTRAYVFTVARNLCIDGWRRQRRRLSVELGEHHVERLIVHPEELEMDRDQRERAETLARYVEQLPPQLSRVYETRFVRGLSQRDASVALGVSRRQIRTLERRLFAGVIHELTSGPATRAP